MSSKHQYSDSEATVPQRAERLSFGADLEPTDTKSRSLEVDVEHYDSDSTSLKVDLEPADTKWRSLETDSSLRAPGPEDKFLPTEVAVNAVHVRAGDLGAAGSTPDDVVGILCKPPAKGMRTISDESVQLTTRKLTCSFTAALLSLCCCWPCSCCALVCSWRAQRQTYEGKHLDARRSFRMSNTLTIISVVVGLVGLFYVLRNAGII